MAFGILKTREGFEKGINHLMFPFTEILEIGEMTFRLNKGKSNVKFALYEEVVSAPKVLTGNAEEQFGRSE